MKLLKDKIENSIPLNKFYWSHQKNLVLDSYTGNVRPHVTHVYSGSQIDWDKTILFPLSEINTTIKNYNLYSGINFIACSEKVLSILRSIDTYHFNDFFQTEKLYDDCEYAGNINNSIKIFKFAGSDENIIVAGYYNYDGIKIVVKQTQTPFSVEFEHVKMADVHLINKLNDFCILEVKDL